VHCTTNNMMESHPRYVGPSLSLTEECISTCSLSLIIRIRPSNSIHPSTAAQKRELPPIQLVLTKCDLVHQTDLARRVVQVRQQLSDSLIRQPSALPVMLVSAQMEGQAGVLELQKELASLVPTIVPTITTSDTANNVGGSNRKQ
jgi:hypothetical protein